jgi:hypothetical protein
MHAPFNGKVRRELRRQLVLNTTWSNLMKRMLGA